MGQCLKPGFTVFLLHPVGDKLCMFPVGCSIISANNLTLEASRQQFLIWYKLTVLSRLLIVNNGGKEFSRPWLARLAQLDLKTKILCFGNPTLPIGTADPRLFLRKYRFFVEVFIIEVSILKKNTQKNRADPTYSF